MDLRSELEQSINETNGRNSDVIQAQITELEEQISTLRERIAQVEHEEEYEFWCELERLSKCSLAT